MKLHSQSLLVTVMLEPERIQLAHMNEILVYLSNTSVLLINREHLIENSSKNNKTDCNKKRLQQRLWNNFYDNSGLLQFP